MDSSYVTLIQPQTWLGEDGWDNQGSGNSRQKSGKKGDIRITKRLGNGRPKAHSHDGSQESTGTEGELAGQSVAFVQGTRCLSSLVPSPKSFPSELSLGIGG